MYIAFTFKCVECGHTENRFVKRLEMDDQKCEATHKAGRLNRRMVRLPAGTRTTFRHADTKLKA